MEQGALHKVGQRPAFVQEGIPDLERLEHLRYRRGDEGGRGQGRTGRPEPALRGAKLTRRAGAADLTAQELCVQLAYEVQR